MPARPIFSGGPDRTGVKSLNGYLKNTGSILSKNRPFK